MRLPDAAKKIKDLAVFEGDLPKDTFLILLILLVGIGGFLIGRLSEQERSDDLEILSVASLPSEKGVSPPGRSVGKVQADRGVASAGAYVASRNGTVFHLPTCPGAKQIREENKVWFSSKAEALAAGYTPAGNCKGL